MRKVEPNAAVPSTPDASPAPTSGSQPPVDKPRVPEIGGYKGPEPTRYGDWEHNGRCTDF